MCRGSCRQTQSTGINVPSERFSNSLDGTWFCRWRPFKSGKPTQVLKQRARWSGRLQAWHLTLAVRDGPHNRWTDCNFRCSQLAASGRPHQLFILCVQRCSPMPNKGQTATAAGLTQNDWSPAARSAHSCLRKLWHAAPPAAPAASAVSNKATYSALPQTEPTSRCKKAPVQAGKGFLTPLSCDPGQWGGIHQHDQLQCSPAVWQSLSKGSRTH